ncbi:hypothetical protein D3C71_1773060 [compost metagenome]
MLDAFFRCYAINKERGRDRRIAITVVQRDLIKVREAENHPYNYVSSLMMSKSPSKRFWRHWPNRIKGSFDICVRKRPPFPSRSPFGLPDYSLNVCTSHSPSPLSKARKNALLRCLRVHRWYHQDHH